MELKLVVLAGAKEGLEIPLKKDKFLIGRAKECSLRAASEAISRRHCALIRTSSGRWAARDLGSRNGTYVNDKRITEPVRLNAGDELRVGPLKFRVTSVAPAEPVEPPTAAPAPGAKPRKQPPVKNVADVVERTISRSDDSASEEDISRWLFGTPDATGEETLKETRTIRLEETKAHNRTTSTGDTATVEDMAAVLDSSGEEQEEQPDAAAGEEAPSEAEAKSGGWNLFKRGKAAAPKQKPGKLPPRPDQASKDSREAAADILREMTRRR